MKKASLLFLQALVIFVSLWVLIFMIVEPRFEGVNAHATLFEIYFHDGFLAYIYASSITFFIGAYQIYKILENTKTNVFTSNSVRALQILKRCALTLIVLIFAAQLYLFIINRVEDDIAGGVAMSLILQFISITVAITAARVEKYFIHTIQSK